MAIKVETQEDYRNFIELAHLVDEMSKHPGWDALTNYWIQTLESDKLSVLRGDYDSLEQYKRETGRITGIHMVLKTPEFLTEAVTRERQRLAEAGDLGEEGAA